MWLLFVACVVGAYALGGTVGVWQERAYWRRYRFCPTCDRLDCAREHD